MQKPLVSVVMPTYNAEQYLNETMDSLLSQTFKNFELLIIDDASKDNTRKIIRSYKDARIKLINGPQKGLAAALNYGIKIANGKYIARMDADDIALPERFAKEVEFLEKNPEYIATAHNVIVVDKNGNIRNDYRCAECKKEEYTLYDFQEGILMGQTASVLYRNYRKFNLLTDLHISVDYPPDQKLNFLLVCNGKIRCFQEKWSAYRYVTDEGSSFSATQKYNKNRYINRINFLKEIKCYAFNKANNIDAQKATETKFLIALLYLIVTNKINYNLFYFFKEFYKAKYKINFIRALCRRVKKLKHNGR